MALKKKRKILFLINPKSGAQSAKRVPQLIEKYIDRNRYDFSIGLTEYAGHASVLAANAANQGYDVVVAVGGDGTINEVGRALAHTSTALGVIPRGSGNGFARHLGIPLTIKGAMEFINKAEIASVDYGKLNGRPFFCACGVGFDAYVSEHFAKSSTRGMFTYVHKTLVDWVTYEPEVYEVEAENLKESYKAFVIACGNASQYGNNAYITPFASMCDGRLSVSVLAPFTPIEVPVIVTQLFSSTLNDNSHMTTFVTKWIKIKRKAAGPVHYDGEPCEMDAELFIEVVPAGIKVLARPGWDGTSPPVPIYKQFYDVVAGVVR
jgi:YegS/Rv2252/BmrU family lipid kinase